MFLFIYFRFWCICYFCVSMTKYLTETTEGRFILSHCFKRFHPYMVAESCASE